MDSYEFPGIPFLGRGPSSEPREGPQEGLGGTSGPQQGLLGTGDEDSLRILQGASRDSLGIL